MDPILLHAHDLLWMMAGATLVLSIPWGFYVRRRFAEGDSELRIQLLAPQTVALLAGIFILATPWSFSGIVLDSLCLIAGYLAYSGFVFLLSLLRPRRWTWILTTAGMLPTAIGMLGFVSAAIVPRGSVPQHEAWLTPNYSYRVANTGGSATAAAAEVSILYHPTVLPFMEKQVFQKTFEAAQYDPAGLQLRLTQDRRKIVIECPRRNSGRVEQTVLETQ